jgi:hypothetical protein
MFYDFQLQAKAFGPFRIVPRSCQWQRNATIRREDPIWLNVSNHIAVDPVEGSLKGKGNFLVVLEL